MAPARTILGFGPLVFLSLASAVVASCGSPQTKTSGSSSTSPDDPEISCPDPIGTIQREICADFADDFGALDVSGALKLVGTQKSAEVRIEAIRAAGDLAKNLKDRRVALCEQYNACKVTPAEHTAEDERLAGMMKSLIDAWDARKFSDPESVTRFRSQVRALSDKLEGNAPAPPSKPGQTQANGTRIAVDSLDKIEGGGLSFSGSSGSVTIKSTTASDHDALRAGADKLLAVAGGRYLVRVSGSYTPSSPALIAAGDELTVRFKARTDGAGEIYVALRSLEDPDASESTSTFPVKPGQVISQTATLTAAPGSSGFFVGIGSRDAGVIELDDVEVVRGGSVIATAKAESASEPFVETSCSASNAKALAGKASLKCDAKTTDRLVIGRPTGHVYMALRSASGGEKAILRALSLEGGRSLDAELPADALLVIGLNGPGSATIQSIEIERLK